MMKKTLLTLSCISVLALGVAGCSSYDHKHYPRESWFKANTEVIKADQFKKVEQPLMVALELAYTWEGRPIVQEPFEDRPADWREQYGLWEATKRYMEQTGLFKVVDADDEKKQGTMYVDLSREMAPATKAALEADPKKERKIVFQYDMRMNMKLVLADGKAYTAEPQTDTMFIGHEDSSERQTGSEPARFTFSYFNNMDFHTEFVRKFYRQMFFEGLKKMESENAF